MSAIKLPIGLQHGMSNAAYHALPSLGCSGIKAMGKSPMHYAAQYLDPDRPVRESTPAMKRGNLVHCAVLEPGEVDTRYAIKPEGYDGRTTAGKEWARAFAGLETITMAEYQAAMRMERAVRALPDIGALLATGHPEVSAFWIDKATGVHCKCRPDWVSPVDDEGVILIDLKTCTDATPSGFSKQVANLGYHLQAAWYSKGYEQASGKKVRAFIFAAVEAEHPHAASAFQLDDEALDLGVAECQHLIELYTDCLKNNRWPGYPADIQPLSLPGWFTAARDIELAWA